MLDGLNPSPKMTSKFKSQDQDKTQGNDFIHNACGPDLERRYEMWRHFFGVQNPLTVTPPRSQCPNFKVFEFFEWM